MRFAKGVGRSLVGAAALCVGAACTEGTPPATSASTPKKTQRSDRPDPFGHSAVACRACGGFVEGQTALTFQGSRDLGAHAWLYEAAKACIARAKRDGWSLEGDLQVEVSVGEDGAPRHACGAHKAMDPKLAACLLDAFDAKVPREAKGRTFATWLVPKELAVGIPAEKPPSSSPPAPLDQCEGEAPEEPAPAPAKRRESDSSPVVRFCGDADERVRGADRVINGARGQIRRCYQDGLNADPDNEGSVAFSLDVGADGTVPRICWSRRGSLSPTVVQCITSALKAVRFDPPAGGRATVGGSFSFVNVNKGKNHPATTTERRTPAAFAAPPTPAWPWPVLVH